MAIRNDSLKILALEEVERTCGIMRLPSGHWPDDANKKIKYNGFVESLRERKRRTVLLSWAKQRVNQTWDMLRVDAGMQKGFGKDPLESMRQIAQAWVKPRQHEEGPQEEVLHLESKGTKPTLFQKWTGLHDIVQAWSAERKFCRSEDEDVRFDDLLASFQDALDVQRERDEAAGMACTVPETVSVGFFCKVKKLLGVRDSAVASTEPKRVSEEDNVNHFAEFRRKLTEHNIDGDMVFSFDEFNEFLERCGLSCFAVLSALLCVFVLVWLHQALPRECRQLKTSWAKMLGSGARGDPEHDSQ